MNQKMGFLHDFRVWMGRQTGIAWAGTVEGHGDGLPVYGTCMRMYSAMLSVLQHTETL